MRKIRIGTRSSELALLQTKIVINRILETIPSISLKDIEIVPITTKGDKILDRSLSEIGGKSLFIKEIENELLNENINLAVHSLKDFTAVLPKELLIGAVIEREDPRDAFVSYKQIKDLCDFSNYIIGTSSCRRKAQLLNLNKNLNILPLRGNVMTRIDKIKNQKVDIAILAAAGLKRLSIDKALYKEIDINEMLPAPGQGVICIEIKANDHFAREICEQINHQDTMKVILAERGFLEAIEGDCNIPIAAYAVISNRKIKLETEVLAIDGREKFKMSGECEIKDGYDFGYEFGMKLKEKIR